MSSPPAGCLGAVCIEPVPDEVQICERIALAKELALRPRWQPDYLAHPAQLDGSVPRETEVVEPIAVHHLLAIAPHPIVRA